MSQPIIKLNLSEREAESLVNIINIAIKAEGIPVAIHGMPIWEKIQEAVVKAKEPDVQS